MIAAVWKFDPVVTIYTSQYEWQSVTCQTDPESPHTKKFMSRLHEIADEVQSKNYTSAMLASHLRGVAESKGLTKTSQWKRPISVEEALEQRSDEKPTRKSPLNIPDSKSHKFGKLGKNMILLWYADWDGQQNFNDFSPFGPFKEPFDKQYNDGGNVCGIPCDLDIAF